MANWGNISGVQEITFTGLKHALKKVNKNAFVCVWTDALGDDTNNAALKADILSLKASTQSEIFIMAIEGNITTGRQNREAPGADDTSIMDRSAISSQNGGEDVRDRQARVYMNEFNQVFGGIGHVMDVMNDPNVIDNIIDRMKASPLCNLKKNTTTTSTESPTTI